MLTPLVDQLASAAAEQLAVLRSFLQDPRVRVPVFIRWSERFGGGLASPVGPFFLQALPRSAATCRNQLPVLQIGLCFSCMFCLFWSCCFFCSVLFCRALLKTGADSPLVGAPRPRPTCEYPLTASNCSSVFRARCSDLDATDRA